MTWPELDDYARAAGWSAEWGGADRENGSVIYNKARAETGEFTSGEIEHKAVRMLKPAHIGLDEFTERDFHVDAVGVLGNFDTRDGGMRGAQAGAGIFLGFNCGHGESGQQKYERYCRMDTHRCGGLHSL